MASNAYNHIMAKAENYAAQARERQGKGYLEEANEYYIRAATFRETARIVEGCEKETV